jgi:hypothetical protein
VASGFVEEKWRGRGGGCRLSGEARRGKKNGGSDAGGTTRRMEEGGLVAGRARDKWRRAPVGDV